MANTPILKINTIGRILFVLVATVVSQVGGITYLLYLSFIKKRISFRNKWITRTARLAAFFTLHWLIVIGLVPQAAKLFDKEPLPFSSDKLKCSNWVSWMCCRNYVKKGVTAELNNIVEATRLATHRFDLQVVYLDAGFPLLNKCQLLPHLSHIDGRQVDLAFCYMEPSDGYQSGKIPNYLGYGMYDEPTEHEVNTAIRCAEDGRWWYGALGWITVWWDDDLVTDDQMTQELLRSIEKSPSVRRIFLEPHLKSRWHLGEKVRFHGCHAVRHDDHVHVDFN